MAAKHESEIFKLPALSSYLLQSDDRRRLTGMYLDTPQAAGEALHVFSEQLGEDKVQKLPLIWPLTVNTLRMPALTCCCSA